MRSFFRICVENLQFCCTNSAVFTLAFRISQNSSFAKSINEDSFELKLINHKKVKGSIANLAFDIEKKGDNLKIKNLDYNEGKKFIKIKNLLIKKNKFFSFKKIEVDTINNNFYVQNGKKILINRWPAQINCSWSGGGANIYI